MRDQVCVELLRWALPRLGLRWCGFRRVRGQVCKRIQRRLHALSLADAAAYREYLGQHPLEWRVLDALCRITVSRFYRDPAVFRFLEKQALAALAHARLRRGGDAVHVWSAGCGSGEEPYTLAFLWALTLAPAFPGLRLELIATDADARLLERAERGCYRASSVRHLPLSWRSAGLFREDDAYCVRSRFRAQVRFVEQDLRESMPTGPFDLVLCRNIAFTYFDAATQSRVARELVARLAPGGALVLGARERLPPDCAGVETWSEPARCYRRPC